MISTKMYSEYREYYKIRDKKFRREVVSGCLVNPLAAIAGFFGGSIGVIGLLGLIGHAVSGQGNPSATGTVLEITLSGFGVTAGSIAAAVGVHRWSQGLNRRIAEAPQPQDPDWVTGE